MTKFNFFSAHLLAVLMGRISFAALFCSTYFLFSSEVVLEWEATFINS
jgi:hypothetical protein